MRGLAIEVPKGLEGVEVDVTKISLVDGEHGRLSYRGHDVAKLHRLAVHARRAARA